MAPRRRCVVGGIALLLLLQICCLFRLSLQQLGGLSSPPPPPGPARSDNRAADGAVAHEFGDAFDGDAPREPDDLDRACSARWTNATEVARIAEILGAAVPGQHVAAILRVGAFEAARATLVVGQLEALQATLVGAGLTFGVTVESSWDGAGARGASAKWLAALGRVRAAVAPCAGLPDVDDRGSLPQQTTRRFKREAFSRNCGLNAAKRRGTFAVLFLDADFLWCASDALRLLSLLKSHGSGADVACAADPDDQRSVKHARLTGASRSSASDAFEHAHFGVDPAYETVCAADLVAPPNASTPRDAWTGDLVSFLEWPAAFQSPPGAVWSARVIWPARVLTCWGASLAISGDHLYGGGDTCTTCTDVPPLRFRAAVPLRLECNAEPQLLLQLDVYRRAAKTFFGGKAVVVYDAGAISSAALSTIAGAPAGVRPGVEELSRAHFADEPLALQPLWRCCEETTIGVGCDWRPTHLDHVAGAYTAEAMYRSAMGRRLAAGPRRNAGPDARRRRISAHRRRPLASGGDAAVDMDEMVEVRKHVSARESAAGAPAIPRTIYQTFKSNRMPRSLAAAPTSWQQQNPEYAYFLFDDDDALRYVDEHYGNASAFASSNFPEAYRTAPSGAHRADLWRYLALYRDGGVYADVDALCTRPVRHWVNGAEALVASLQGPPRFDVSQWAFATPPENPILLLAAQKAAQRVLARKYPSSARPAAVEFRGLRRVLTGGASPQSSGYDVELRFDCPDAAEIVRIANEALTGPPVLQTALEEIVVADARRMVGPHATAQDFRVASQLALRRLVVLRPTYFGGAVLPKYTAEADYRRALALANMTHWQQAYDAALI